MKLLLLIITLASIFRFYGLNWDQNSHLHPDERMITMVSLNLHLPQTETEWDNLFTSKSSLNPKFFAYGSLPLYLLKSSGWLVGQINPFYAGYDGINLLGRALSAIFDLGTLLILFLLGKKLINKQVGLLAALFYALAVLPIQLSHFYAVDTPLTFFITATLYRLLHLSDKPSIKNAIFVGVLFGLAMATKTSALVLTAPIVVTLTIKFFPFQKPFHAPNLLISLKNPALVLSPLALSFILTFLLTEPFALIDFPTFLKQTLEQQTMTKSAFTFPYTLQYVGKISYLYELKNIFLWGIGPILATLAFIGTVYICCRSILEHLGWWQADPERSRGRSHDSSEVKLLIILSFFWVYFLVVGNFAIGFMRYMLPLYPLLILFAAIFIEQLKYIKKLKYLKLPFFILLLIWPLSFMNIYTQPNTRVQATEWINSNIPRGTAIATEHWDDGLPLGTQGNYQVYELPMYESDNNPLKWTKINQALNNSQYIIIASNRLYTPLQKLTNCEKLPQGRCYTKTTKYYQDLFNGKLGFKKVKEFSLYPTLPFVSYSIDDQAADESFTVYDHPKIMIFKKLPITYAK